MYILRCEMNIVQCTTYNAHCTLCIVYLVQCALYNVQCKMYNVQCTMYYVQCAMYNVQCTMYNAQCNLLSAKLQVCKGVHVFKTNENTYFYCMLTRQAFINKNELDCIEFICCKNLSFTTNSNFRFPLSLQPDGVHQRYFKLRLLNLTEFIV